MGGSDESEWEEEQEQPDEEDQEHVDQEDQEQPDEEELAASKQKKQENDNTIAPPTITTVVSTAKPKKPPRVRKTPRRVNFEEEGEDLIIDHLPSYERKTDQGGYAHTQASRKKIAEANKGNVPWNKGKERSSTAKSNIGAGVRARNHALLMAKLQKLGMTEVQWYVKKKELKVIRERVRKTKLAAEQRQQDIANWPWRSTGVVRMAKGEPEPVRDDEEEESSESEESSEEEEVALPPPKAKPETSILTGESTARIAQIVQASRKRKEPSAAETATISLSHREVIWTPHLFDTDIPSCPNDSKKKASLLCCTACAAHYSQWLSQTYHDLERQTMHNIGKEVRELLELRAATQQNLRRTVQHANQPLFRSTIPTMRNLQQDATQEEQHFLTLQNTKRDAAVDEEEAMPEEPTDATIFLEFSDSMPTASI